MEKLFLTLVLFWFSVCSFAEDYSFSVIKSGIGKKSVIFIPGFASSGDVWKEAVAELGTHYTCYVLTMAGFAGVPPEKNPSFEGWKNEIATFIKEERIDSPILVGHSMGGGLALAVAADFPTLVGKIVIVDALPCLMALTHPDFNPVADKDCSDMITRITAMNHEQFVRMQRMSVASLTTDSLKFDEIVEWGAASDRKTYAAMYCDFANTDLRERIRSIAVRSWSCWNLHFKNIASIVNEQYRNLHGVRLRCAEQGLHFMMFDDKEWFMNELTGFIKE